MRTLYVDQKSLIPNNTHYRSNSYDIVGSFYHFCCCWSIHVDIVVKRMPTIVCGRNVNVHMCEHIIDCVIVVVVAEFNSILFVERTHCTAYESAQQF